MRYIFLLVILSTPVYADGRASLLLETGRSEASDKDTGGLFFTSGVGGFSISSGDDRLSGTHLGIEVMNRITDNFAFGPGVSQGYTADGGLATYFTSYEMNVSYSIIGKLRQNSVRMVEGGSEAYKASRSRGLGLRLNGGLRQCFLNLRSGALYFSGLMAGVSSSYGLSPGFDLSAGVSYEVLSSGYRTISMQKLFVGFSADLK